MVLQSPNHESHKDRTAYKATWLTNNRRNMVRIDMNVESWFKEMAQHKARKTHRPLTQYIIDLVLADNKVKEINHKLK